MPCPVRRSGYKKPVAVLYPDEIYPPEGGLIQLRRAYESFLGSWIGLTPNQHKRREAVLKTEKVKQGVFQTHGFYNEKNPYQIGYGTGRYILDSEFAKLINSLFQTASEA